MMNVHDLIPVLMSQTSMHIVIQRLANENVIPEQGTLEKIKFEVHKHTNMQVLSDETKLNNLRFVTYTNIQKRIGAFEQHDLIQGPYMASANLYKPINLPF